MPRQFEPGNTVGRHFAPGNALAKRHGHTSQGPDGKVHKSLTYQSWSSMNDRCGSETHKWWEAYGGRGIKVCERWQRGRGNPDAFVNFLEDMGERPCKEMSLDRVDVNGNYELHGPDGKLQCRWATRSEQRNNQRPRTTEPAPPSIEDDAANEVPY